VSFLALLRRYELSLLLVIRRATLLYPHYELADGLALRVAPPVYHLAS
jgi:hypothetical protein